MDQLLSNLQAAHRKHVSDSVWAAVEAAEHTLAAFRKQVEAGSLAFSHRPAPHYVFDPASGAPAEKTAVPGSWERYSDFVLDVIRSSTGMRVEWSPGNAIELYLPGPCLEAASPCILPPGAVAALFPGGALPPELLLGDGAFSCAGCPAEGPVPPSLVAALREAAGAGCGTLEIDGHFGLTASFDSKAPARAVKAEPPSPLGAAGAPPSPKAECPPKAGPASKSSRPDNLDTNSGCCPKTPAPMNVQFTGTGTMMPASGSGCCPMPTPTDMQFAGSGSASPSSAPPMTLQFTGAGTVAPSSATA